MTDLARSQSVFGASPERTTRDPRPVRSWVLLITSGLVVTATSIVMAAVGALTMFRARRLYRAMARLVSVGVLRLYGIRIRVQGAPFPRTQTVFVSNHTSTLDLFVIVGLGLPHCRYFLSGFLRKLLPLGAISWMLGTFFTVPQDRPLERRRIFERAERVLRRTGESVYLSPEGGRITGGTMGHFNKGAFHLATNLRAPIVPFYIGVPPEVDPRLGFDARSGVVDVLVLPAIDTRAWTIGDLELNAAHVRSLLVRAQEELS